MGNDSGGNEFAEGDHLVVVVVIVFAVGLESCNGTVELMEERRKPLVLRL